MGAKVFIASADGSDIGEAREVTDGDCPTWSPDGKRIACCESIVGKNPVIKVTALATKESVVLGNVWYRGEWSADGKTLVCNGFFNDGQPRNGMVRLSTEAARESEPLFPGFREASSPSQSVGGKVVVFVVEPAKLRPIGK